MLCVRRLNDGTRDHCYSVHRGCAARLAGCGACAAESMCSGSGVGDRECVREDLMKGARL